jgi:hypothetical protein
MVSPARTLDSLAEDPLQADVDVPYVEHHFPRQMSWYAPEGPQGAVEAVGRWVRENPWTALGLGVALGAALSLLAGPAVRAGARRTGGACGGCGCSEE